MKVITKMITLSLLLASGFHSETAFAQSTLHADGNWHRISYSGKYQDYTVPTTAAYPYIQFRVVGADGGSSKARVNDCATVVGGAGAIVTAVFEYSTEFANFDKHIQPGQTLRFIVGGGGGSVDYKSGGGAGGGGGSAVLLYTGGQPDPYRILAVAGGGGGAFSRTGGFGACYHDPGNSAQTGTSGGTADGDGESKGSPGTGGNGAKQNTLDINYGGGGGGAFSDAYYQDYYPGKPPLAQVGKKGSWEGGKGGWQDVAGDQNTIKGGYGFGGGGGGYLNYEDEETVGPGGGGGYSGGANGEGVIASAWYFKGSGGGGGSYVLPGIFSSNITVGERTKTTNDGYIEYRFVKFKNVKLSSDHAKCLDVTGGSTNNGSNIQLWTCNSEGAQKWDVDGLSIRLAKALNKCLDLANGNTGNGTNIRLWDCNGSNAQKWIYDVGRQAIRSSIDFDKCIDLTQSNTADGTNIQLYSCNNTGAQKWQVEGLPSAMPTGTNNRIHLAMKTGKCIDVKDAHTANGTNIQLNTCTSGNAQYFLFDGRRIKMQAAPDKCISPDPTSPAGAINVILLRCDETNLQEWIYDGFSQAFRSAVNTNMCLDLDQSNTADGTNIQLYNCNGTDAQKFLLGN